MKYTIIITNTYGEEAFIKTRKRIDIAIDDFWFFVEDGNKGYVKIFKEDKDITDLVLADTALKNKYYKGLGF